ncbi:MAG: class I SAM-dependent methyltransferase [Bryobacteraceae bacterium]
MAIQSTLPPLAQPKAKPTAVAEGRRLGKMSSLVLGRFAVLVLGSVIVVAATSFPYRTDAVTHRGIPQPADYDAFYKRIYAAAPVAQGASANATEDPEDEAYVRIAREAIRSNHVVEGVQAFIKREHLEKSRVLDVGAGTGYLQDLVQNYVGLDISPTASRYYHKPFIQASATDMPIPDNDFDLIWSIWVLEHVPNPEQALAEIRRVAKDGGLLYLMPAWNCDWYMGDGYRVRAFSDLDWKGKLTKAEMNFRMYPLFNLMVQAAQRLILGARPSGPTSLHYVPLKANYDHYWVADSDAINRLDRYEMSLWFTSRGDECLNCDFHLLATNGPLIIKVHKK